jgi:decaprenylphospho-beta-D-ribofuranose 2-oxidase
MRPDCVSFAAIERHAERLESYSGLCSTAAVVLYPTCREEVLCIFEWAQKRRRRVTLRAGGHSFDSQALGNDLVVSMKRMNRIRVNAEDRLVCVGAGATWGAILNELEPHGLVPAVTVTTAHATAGGTLSGDCLSRFSPAYGKEGEWIDSFEVVTPDLRCFTCRRPSDPNNPKSLQERLFLGVIGGLGYLGAVISITYHVVYVGETGGQIGVETDVRQFRSFHGLAGHLMRKVPQARDERNPSDESKLDSIWSTVLAEGKREDALVFTSFFTSRSFRHRMGLHQPGLPLRVLVEWAMTVPPLPSVLWRLAFQFLYPDRTRFVDDLEGFTFFMDGNRKAKEIARALGWRLKALQQTFIVPSDPDSDAGWDRAGDNLVTWLKWAQRYLANLKLTPTLQDILWLPEDLPFRLSATAGKPGFAVSYAFETSDDDVLELAKRAFVEMSDVLWDRFKGRVYLVKNVCAGRQTLAEMYGDNALKFFALKGEVDPQGILANAFLERTFGGVTSVPSGAPL